MPHVIQTTKITELWDKWMIGSSSDCDCEVVKRPRKRNILAVLLIPFNDTHGRRAAGDFITGGAAAVGLPKEGLHGPPA